MLENNDIYSIKESNLITTYKDIISPSIIEESESDLAPPTRALNWLSFLCPRKINSY